MEALRLRSAWRAAAGALLLAACAGPELPEPAPAVSPPPGSAGEQRADLAAAGWTVCAVDPEASLLQIFVYRAGRLARLGHNHVISARRIGGHLAFAGPRLTADLHLPVATLDVDEPALRAAAGDAFASELTQRDRDGTRSNLLGPRVLDAAAHPYLRALIPARDWSRTYPELAVDFRVAGRQVRSTVRLDRFEAGVARGGFRLTHDALGLEPFTALGGALRVADEIEVRFELGLVGGDGACRRQGTPVRVAGAP